MRILPLISSMYTKISHKICTQLPCAFFRFVDIVVTGGYVCDLTIFFKVASLALGKTKTYNYYSMSKLIQDDIGFIMADIPVDTRSKNNVLRKSQ